MAYAIKKIKKTYHVYNIFSSISLDLYRLLHHFPDNREEQEKNAFPGGVFGLTKGVPAVGRRGILLIFTSTPLRCICGKFHLLYKLFPLFAVHQNTILLITVIRKKVDYSNTSW